MTAGVVIDELVCSLCTGGTCSADAAMPRRCCSHRHVATGATQPMLVIVPLPSALAIMAGMAICMLSRASPTRRNRQLRCNSSGCVSHVQSATNACKQMPALQRTHRNNIIRMLMEVQPVPGTTQNTGGSAAKRRAIKAHKTRSRSQHLVHRKCLYHRTERCCMLLTSYSTRPLAWRTDMLAKTRCLLSSTIVPTGIPTSAVCQPVTGGANSCPGCYRHSSLPGRLRSLRPDCRHSFHHGRPQSRRRPDCRRRNCRPGPAEIRFGMMLVYS